MPVEGFMVCSDAFKLYAINHLAVISPGTSTAASHQPSDLEYASRQASANFAQGTYIALH
jgi:hypothetical protein